MLAVRRLLAQLQGERCRGELRQQEPQRERQLLGFRGLRREVPTLKENPGLQSRGFLYG